MTKELEHSFVKELETNQNIVHKICRLYTNNSHAHNDLFQEITIQLWKAYPKFRGDSKFSTWMYRVALNTAITLYRKSKRTVATQDFEAVSFKISSIDISLPSDQENLLSHQGQDKLQPDSLINIEGVPKFFPSP